MTQKAVDRRKKELYAELEKLDAEADRLWKLRGPRVLSKLMCQLAYLKPGACFYTLEGNDFATLVELTAVDKQKYTPVHTGNECIYVALTFIQTEHPLMSGNSVAYKDNCTMNFEVREYTDLENIAFRPSCLLKARCMLSPIVSKMDALIRPLITQAQAEKPRPGPTQPE